MATKREIFAQNLRKTIENSYLNQAQLAEICGVSKGSFSDWANGRSYPRPDKLETLARALGVSEYDLTTNFDNDDARVYMNKEVAKIAKDLYENPDARGLYEAIKRLDEPELRAMKQIVFSLQNRLDSEKNNE